MIWTDAHLSPRIAKWIEEEFGHPAKPLRDIGLRDAADDEIFSRARVDNVIVMTKDRDFPDLIARYGSPPKVIWLRMGNTTNRRLIEILTTHLSTALKFLEDGNDVVEVCA